MAKAVGKVKEKIPGAPTLSFKSHSVITKLMVLIFLKVLSVLVLDVIGLILGTMFWKKKKKEKNYKEDRNKLRSWMGYASIKAVSIFSLFLALKQPAFQTWMGEAASCFALLQKTHQLFFFF